MSVESVKPVTTCACLLSATARIPDWKSALGRARRFLRIRGNRLLQFGSARADWESAAAIERWVNERPAPFHVVDKQRRALELEQRRGTGRGP